MSWIELNLDTTHEAVDWVCTLLAETIDINDVYITKYDQLTGANSQWTFTVRLYVAYDVNAGRRVEKIVNLLSPLHRTGMTTAVEKTIVREKITDVPQSIIHSIGERFVVLNSDKPNQWEIPDKINLKLQRTSAFGSGLHPATILTLQLLERYVVPNMRVLDLGSGSGILSVAMAKLGAHVLALDNDTLAVQATQKAVCLNGVEQQVEVMLGSLGCGSDLGHWMGGNTVDYVPKIEPENTFDLIVANILARVHINLAHDFRRSLRQNQPHTGVLITAGFTTDHEENVIKALNTVGFETTDCERLNEWVALVHKYNS
ncbi:50S ribosomal protein L11 methyltransferase [Umezakia ovalisporum]|uniref:50S ribosomal protein L11 methyltransferase n=2 Tax=Umezakia ovalisporum TaxID=75695 RepID=A0AA43GVX6_9CYAN|nr:50S ribosomal protein L11 methyltransferase [Umezakia ovalisporum]MDH6055326.1 50S ribosomal protein L11 methyltransferase [Umezakia ovalisporum FSS-43]MDH6062631.1 50S ribosomal protein L11 methyltransferase [Umezakia ovalisporum FSS-62]MDH6066419.1 50S ribosomal protein L11 methyltransferase [Umezakia ovalisporum APH033B]MDH6071261.1 50S ribosomal protein L11 methyltransferase [Umezakia ovalisporum CobakiLakeA]MDH6073735.1 50S ribosomal protein L11 methyltransferase [Umezakia ovalisporum 